jgi:hypothetical protein
VRGTAAVVTHLQADVSEIDGELTAQASSIQQVSASLGDAQQAIVQWSPQ